MSRDASTRSEGLWFPEDSPVVLRAENRVFCVSKSILAARSSVFQSMFEFPQPTAEQVEMMEGRPVIQLHDRAAELEPFLRAIFDSSYFMEPPAEIDFRAVLGILRLSHKYDVPYLFRRAVRHLETVYPIELAKYPSTITSDPMEYHYGDVCLDLEALPVLFEVGATWLLPCAFYSIGTYPAEEFIRTEAWDSLLPETKLTCLMLQVKQLRAMTKLNAFLATDPTCDSAQACSGMKLLFLRTTLTHRSPTGSGDLHPLCEWPPKRLDKLEKGLCATCNHAGRTQRKGAEMEIWTQLPANCGLAAWDVLLEQRRVSLNT
ncbi:hypothetical protein DFH06DRAFT_1206198 [Mycena polygramma]|nr:hypothetical protein DFH06DRAFT_1206198 [Mycena polygramma]